MKHGGFEEKAKLPLQIAKKRKGQPVHQKQLRLAQGLQSSDQLNTNHIECVFIESLTHRSIASRRTPHTLA
jgi:hypothetical protein